MWRKQVHLAIWATVLLIQSQLMGQVSTAGRDECAGAFGNSSGLAVVGFTSGRLFAPSSGGIDTFVKKYSPTGLVQWSKQFGSSAANFGADVVMDVDGNVYVLGTTEGALSTRVGGRDSFLRKFDPAGTVVWTRQFGTVADDLAIKVAVDALGNIFVLAQENLALPNPGFVIRRFNRQGSALQRVQVTNRPGLTPRGLAVDSANNVIVLTDWVDDTGTGQNLLVYKYTGTLTQVWQRKYQTADADEGYDIATSGTDIYFTAHYGSFGARVIKTNETGSVLWARSLEPPNASGTATFPDALTTDVLGNVYITGSNAGESYAGYHNAGLHDVIAFKFDGAGNRVWMTQMDETHHGTDQIDAGLGLAISGILYVVGSTFGDMQLGLERTLTDEDGFVAGLDPTSGEVLGIDQYVPIGP